MLATYGGGRVAPGFPPYTAAEVGAARRAVLRDRKTVREGLLRAMRARGLIGPAEDGLGSSARAAGLTAQAPTSITPIIPASPCSAMWQWNTLRPAKSRNGIRISTCCPGRRLMVSRQAG